MNKLIAGIVMMLICASGSLGIQTPVEWIEYNSPDGRYTVSVPKTPKLSEQDASNSEGLTARQYLAIAVDSRAAYVVGYFDYASTSTFDLSKARDGMLKSVNGTLVSESSVSLGGYPGLQIDVLGKTPEAREIAIRARVYAVDKRVYVLQFITLKSEESSSTTARSKFFDSFQVKK